MGIFIRPDFLPLVYFKVYEVFSVNGLKKNYFKILTISKSSLEYFEEGTKPYNKFKEDIERFKNEFDLQNHLTSIL